MTKKPAILALVVAAATSVATACQKEEATDTPPRLVPAAPAADDVAAGGPEDIEDSQIEIAVRTELSRDDGVPEHRISVAVEDGIVTLHGTSDHLLGKRRAVDIAEHIKGVRAVVDRIDVHPGQRSDAEIEADIRQALLMDPAADAYEIQVSVEGGTAHLGGNVDSWGESEIAEHVAAAVDGVVAVDNKTVIDYTSERTAAEIEADVRRRLAIDSRLDAGLIEVSVDGAEVELVGTVGSAAELRIARSLAWVAGVRAVDADDLEVQWWARDAMRRSVPVRWTDAEIRKAVVDALLYDPRVLSFEPRVTVERGAVTLTGEVGSVAAKRAAETDARNTVGVWRVNNLLEVRPPKAYSDAELTSRVQEALRWSPYLHEDEIEVSTKNGRVRLDGSVDGTYESAQAANIAAGIDGVVDVDNSLEVKPSWKLRSRWELQQDLDSFLAWDPRIDDSKVTVSVEDGVAWVRGEVADWGALRAVEDNVLKLGLDDVRIDVRVQSGGPEAARASGSAETASQ